MYSRGDRVYNLEQMYEIGANCIDDPVDDSLELENTASKVQGGDLEQSRPTDLIESCGVNLIDSEFLGDLDEILEGNTRFDALSVSEPSLLEKYRHVKNDDDGKVKPKGNSSRGFQNSSRKSEAMNKGTVGQFPSFVDSNTIRKDSKKHVVQANKSIPGNKKKDKIKENRHFRTEKGVDGDCVDKKTSSHSASAKHMEKKQFNVGLLKAFL